MSADRIAEMTALRDAASEAYYGGATESPITDEEFDAVLAELRDLGVDESVGHGYIPAGKVAHAKPMLSLAKVRTEAEVRRFVERTASSGYDVTLKYDGLAVSLIYKPVGTHDLATFDRAVTRGTGTYGEDVTAAIMQMIDAGAIAQDMHYPNAPAEIDVRGEIMLTAEDFAAINVDGKYSNPRNAAAGILRRSANDEQRRLTFVVHDYNDLADPDGFTMAGDHYAAYVNTSHSDDVVADLMAEIAKVDQLRKILPFDTDGVVIKTHPTDRARLGEGSHTPNWAVAYKFASEVSTTTLLDVKWQLGRSGKLTPVAVFEPVTLAGASVTQATLHNAKFIADLDLHIGDILEVTRSGEVIPYVLGASRGTTTTALALPSEWDGRDGVTYSVVDDGINLRVDGYTDPVPTIVYGLKTLGILGIADSLITKLVDAGIVATLPDMLAVTAEQIAGLDRQGTKSGENAVAAIRDGLAGATVARWFATIGITGLGRTTGRILEAKFGTLDKIAEATERDLDGLEGFGPITTAELLANRHRVKALADALRTHDGYEPGAAPKPATIDSVLTGLNVVITGTIPGMTRDEAGEAATRLGAIVRGSVSKSTDLLIAGDGAGSKITKAEQLGVKVMAATEFAQIAAS